MLEDCRASPSHPADASARLSELGFWGFSSLCHSETRQNRPRQLRFETVDSTSATGIEGVHAGSMSSKARSLVSSEGVNSTTAQHLYMRSCEML